MRLEDVSAVIRPREQWEAVDLGFAMTRRHFPQIIAAWSLTVLPLWLLLLGLSWFIPFGWSIVLIWWLKPVYDRVPLFIISRSLFGATPSLKTVLKAWPRMIFNRLPWLLFHRVPWLIVAPHFAWSRALTLPVFDLEQQKGRALKERMQVLLRIAGGKAGMLVLVCGLYETVLVFALLTLGITMTGEMGDATELGNAFIDMAFRGGEMQPWLKWTLVAGYLVSMTLVEIFYIGGGFGLYLNCRAQLEGWDVEISFRRLARRLQKTAAILLLFAFSATSGAVEIEKPSAPLSIEQKAIKEVLSQPDFKVHTVKKRKVTPDEDVDLGDGKWLAAIGQVLYYTIIAAVIAWLIWLIYKNRHVFRRTKTAGPTERAEPRTIMGMDVSPESLPEDIVAAARAKWAAGDARAALSLLYRGSLSWLIHNARLPVREGDTEGDCVRHTRAVSQAPQREYFSELTVQWILIAYAERDPQAADIERLLNQWPYRTEEAVK